MHEHCSRATALCSVFCLSLFAAAAFAYGGVAPPSAGAPVNGFLTANPTYGFHKVRSLLQTLTHAVAALYE